MKMHKTPQLRSTFRSCDVEKVHAVVARSTFRRQNAQSWILLEAVTSKKWSPLWREAHFEVNTMLKTPHVRATFGRSAVVSRGSRNCAPCQKRAKREDFVESPKTMAGVGRSKRICKDAFSVAAAVQETCSSELLGGPGADFLRRVAFWILRDRCSTSYDLASLFSAAGAVL